MAAIDNAFGSVENFVTEFTKRAMSLFGSGWVWLYVDGTGEGEPELLVTTTANQDTPAMIVCARVFLYTLLSFVLLPLFLSLSLSFAKVQWESHGNR